MKKKILTGLIVLIALILAITPKFIGNIARENIEKKAAIITDLPGYRMTIHEYDQGWFTSRAMISYGFDAHTLDILEKSAKEGDALDVKTVDLLKNGITYDVTIAHGPITFQNGINFALLTMTGDLQNTKASGFMSVSYGGTSDITANSPAFKSDFVTTSGEKFVLDFGGMDMQATINDAEYALQVNLGQLNLQGKKATILLDRVNLTAKGDKINDYLWLGSGNIEMGELNISNKNAAALSLKNYIIKYNLDKEDDTALAMNITANIENIGVAMAVLNNFQLEMNLNRLDIAATTEYIKSIQQAYQGDAAPEEIAAEIQLIAAQIGEKLLKKSPEFIVRKLGFSMDGGYVKSEGSLRFNGEDLENMAQLSDPLALNKRLAVQANLRFDKALVRAILTIGIKQRLGAKMDEIPPEQLEKMIDVQIATILKNYITPGYLTQSGDDYTTHFEMKDGKRLINGKPLAIPGL